LLDPDPKPFWKWYPGELPSKQTANSKKKKIKIRRNSKEKKKRSNLFSLIVEIGRRTGACVLGIMQQGEVDQIGSDGVAAIELMVDARVIVAPRVGD
jgi:hypothetical protein